MPAPTTATRSDAAPARSTSPAARSPEEYAPATVPGRSALVASPAKNTRSWMGRASASRSAVVAPGRRKLPDPRANGSPAQSERAKAVGSGRPVAPGVGVGVGIVEGVAVGVAGVGVVRVHAASPRSDSPDTDAVRRVRREIDMLGPAYRGAVA